jgi:hypothetical protein
MATQTARRHIANALRSRLRITASAANGILASFSNDCAIFDLTTDMRGCVALAASNDRWVSIYAAGEDGLYDHVVSLDVPAEHRHRWEIGSIEDAYRVPDHVSFRSIPPMVDIDEPIDLDQTPEEAMDEVYGKAPEPHVWMDGTIDSVEVDRDRDLVIAHATVGGAGRRYAMIPLFGTVDDVADHARGRIGVDARLCVEARFGGNPEDQDAFDGTLDMILPKSDYPYLRKAA